MLGQENVSTFFFVLVLVFFSCSICQDFLVVGRFVVPFNTQALMISEEGNLPEIGKPPWVEMGRFLGGFKPGHSYSSPYTFYTGIDFINRFPSLIPNRFQPLLGNKHVVCYLFYTKEKILKYSR